MKNIQEIFTRVQEANKQRRDIRNQYKDSLVNLVEYKNITDEIKNMQIKKKQIENVVQAQLAAEFTQLEALEAAIKGDMQSLSDIALTTLVRGEPVAVTDEYDNNYEPLFSVKFKKAD